MKSYLKRFLKKFKRNADGVTAVESAILLPVFVVALVEGMNLLMFMHASNSLDQAVKVTAAELRLNQSRSAAESSDWTSEEYFRQTVCENLSMSSCLSTLEVEMEIYNLSGEKLANPADGFANASSLVVLNASFESDLPDIILDLPSVKTSRLFYTEPF